MPVSYDGAQTLKCTVNFNFSRYITSAYNSSQFLIQLQESQIDTDSRSRKNETGLIAPTNEGAQESAFAAGDSRFTK